ncbi:hypothetical protein GCM10017673_07670 [Streptosporangium violaceochromogenes]|nr:hypothetical protein GCM10017673_07670 [Streptosporangium violaceochromogenes]
MIPHLNAGKRAGKAKCGHTPEGHGRIAPAPLARAQGPGDGQATVRLGAVQVLHADGDAALKPRSIQ